MARYLVIAHQTAESPELLERLRGLAASDSRAEFVLLVPATPVCNMWVCDELETARTARRRAAAAEDRMKREGLRLVAARVGDADPIDTLRDELRRDDSYDKIVISTLPPGVSRWLKMDVLARAARLRPGREVISVVAGSVPEPVQARDSVTAQQ
ncbi:MAG TPA: hypothetical protein VK457_23130 [Chloroflexota bacterium]|nr:hypothetical protein [Chloroflexota bacterium]